MFTGANTTQQAVTQADQPKASTGGGGARHRRNLGRLSDLDDDNERKSQYNGNSTEQDS